jgi:hypothetical protein
MFVEESNQGNPYRWCPCCRHKAFVELVAYAQKYIPHPKKGEKKK